MQALWRRLTSVSLHHGGRGRCGSLPHHVVDADGNRCADDAGCGGLYHCAGYWASARDAERRHRRAEGELILDGACRMTWPSLEADPLLRTCRNSPSAPSSKPAAPRPTPESYSKVEGS